MNEMMTGWFVYRVFSHFPKKRGEIHFSSFFYINFTFLKDASEFLFFCFSKKGKAATEKKKKKI